MIKRFIISQALLIMLALAPAHANAIKPFYLPGTVGFYKANPKARKFQLNLCLFHPERTNAKTCYNARLAQDDIDKQNSKKKSNKHEMQT